MTRQNLCPNPACGTNVTGWGGGSTPTQVSGLVGLPVTTGARYTANGFARTPTAVAAAGGSYTGSLYVANNTGTSLGTKTVYLAFVKPGGDDFSQTASFALPTGVTRVNVTGVAPAGTTGVYLVVDSFNAGFGTGVDLTACLLEAAGALDTYFDGDTADASWDGTSDNSTSTLADPPSGTAVSPNPQLVTVSSARPLTTTSRNGAHVSTSGGAVR